MDGVFVGFPNDRPVSSLTQSEWIKIFRDVIKQNNGAGLYYSLRKLPDALKNICEEAVDGSNLLEFAILHSSWTAAHLLASFISNPSIKIVDPLNFKADEDKWANAIHVILKNYLKTREIQSLHKESYQSALKERMKAYLIAFNNGCVNLFSSVKYPRTFILLHKLGADIRQKNDQRRTIVQCIIDSKKMKFNIKIELLEYVKRVAKELINEPSGVYGSPPVFRCYKFNLVKVLRELDLPFNQVIQLQNAYGKTFADQIDVKRLKTLLTSEQRLELFIHEGALDSLFAQSAKTRVQLEFPELVHAFEIIVKQGRHPIPKFVVHLTIPQLVLYLHYLGVKEVPLRDLKQYVEKNNVLVESEKKRIENRMLIGSKNFIGHFPLDRLPADMLSLLAVHLTLQDMIALFSVSKVMRDKFNSPHNSESMLWKIIAKNTFNKVKFSMREQIGINNDRNWKNILIKDSRLESNWRNGKFIERTIARTTNGFTLNEHWGCWSVPGGVTFWNCDTDEKLIFANLNPSDGSYGFERCFVESRPTRDPIVAVKYNTGQQKIIRVVSPTQILNWILLPASLPMAYGLAALDQNRIVFGGNLYVADINQGKIIKSLPTIESVDHSVNTFSTSPVIAAVAPDHHTLKFFDRDLNQVQNINLPIQDTARRITALDEHEYLLATYGGFVLFDARYIGSNPVYGFGGARFPPKDLFRRYGSYTATSLSVDPGNKRMLMHVEGYGFSMLWDLKNLTCRSVARNNHTRMIYPYSFSVINSRYHVFTDSNGVVKAYNYDI